MSDWVSLFSYNRSDFYIIDPESNREILLDGADSYEEFYLDIIFGKYDTDNLTGFLFIENLLPNPILSKEGIERIFNWIRTDNYAKLPLPTRKAIDDYILKLSKLALSNPNITEEFVYKHFEDFCREMLKCKNAERFIIEKDLQFFQVEKEIDNYCELAHFSDKFYSKIDESRIGYVSWNNPNLSAKFFKEVISEHSHSCVHRFFQEVPNNECLRWKMEKMKIDKEQCIHYIFQNKNADLDTIKMVTERVNMRGARFMSGLNCRLSTDIFRTEWEKAKTDEMYGYFLMRHVHLIINLSIEMKISILSYFDSLRYREHVSKFPDIKDSVLKIMNEDEILNRIDLVFPNLPNLSIKFNETVILKSYLGIVIKKINWMKEKFETSCIREIIPKIYENVEWINLQRSHINRIQILNVSVKFLRKNICFIDKFPELLENRQNLDETIAKRNFKLLRKMDPILLNNHILYGPGSVGYKNAKSHFEGLL